MANTISVDKLENLRIHELRDLARNFGVKCPTSMKKEQIIDEITQILAGEKEPYFNTARHGRPLKHLPTEVNMFLPTEDKGDYLSDASRMNDQFKSMSLAMPTSAFSVLEDYVEVSGYVDIAPDGYGILRRNGYLPSPKDVYVSLQLVKQYSLVSGNFVVGKAKSISSDKPELLIAITKIENKGGEYNFDSCDYLPLGKELNSAFPFKVEKGGRYYVDNQNPHELYCKALAIAQNIKQNNDCIVRVLNIATLPERLPATDNNIETFSIMFNKSDNDMINGANLYIEKCKREAESNNVVLIIAGLSELIRAYNNTLNGVVDMTKVNPVTISKIKNILAVAKNINETMGITLFVIENKDMDTSIKEIVDKLTYLFSNK